jgi:5-(carboxyamino)imidazole ribonucleotide mutase
MAQAKLGVAVVVGSDSDLQAMATCMTTLRALGVPHEVRVVSAHRTPEVLHDFVNECSTRVAEDGSRAGVIIAAAGSAAHLAGVIAGMTDLPVVGVPMPGGAFAGKDALLSTVQMPSGVPVATVAVGRAGPVNAAVLAGRIIALSDPDVAAKLREYRLALAAKVKAADAEHRSRWPEGPKP